ncbi:cell surface protein [Bifidobacterium adolescentis]|uniref:SpaA isopeptide-forming pilin-related protein n=1 Tax=Bifidobacterium adolescentis TaxID=1680 RepID=UPI000A1911DA|nr:SpaA isopeptide-forming pilin-related protein [Bifidobacterium adolescentis]OSG91148.1 cell surface protein [Bifidobacterium adolescentis]
MKQWLRGGANNTPHHASGTRATDRALSHTRSLTAAAIAVAMMATVTVTSLLPTYSAKADTAKAGICTPKPISLGDNVGDLTVDSGVATYVGGNMYVGANNQNRGGAYNTLNASQKIDKSYAVEAEGLTLVNGKLATNGVKTSWNSKGFRFGVVGFGAQFRPKSGSDVLVVAGNSTSDTGNSTGYMWDAGNSSKSVSALGGFDNGSTGRAFVQNTDSNLTWYSARIKGDTSWHLNADTNSSGSNAGRSVWDATASTDATDTNVYYDNNIGLSNVTLNGATKDYSTFYTNNVLGLSTHLAGLQNSDGAHVAEGTVGTAESSTQTSTTGATYSNGYYTRHHYNFGDNQIQYGFKFGASGSNAEKLITFTGDGTSAMQVFNIDATQLSSDGYRGVDFNFTNIPGNASVVVNVSGGNVDFHTGWRFWWNDLEIGDGYSKAATAEQKTAYSTAAQKIMWNFKDATQVTIRGGVATEGAGDGKETHDDPAAAMLGSILVPHGNFEDHVTTNGRVYVGGDFSMYNPTAIPYVNNNDGWEGRTASVINMDQERHNLPWNGTFNSSCAVIQINKVDSSKNALAGTTWGVFKNYADAKAGTAANALRVVKDGGAFDLDDTDNGTIQIGSLNPNATYYLKEIASASGYQVSDKVYQITAGAGGSTAQDVKESSDGTTWTAVADNWIVNEKKGASLEWSKVDGSDSNKVLSGSEWQLTTSDGQTAYQITDSTKSVESVKIYYNGNVQSETITMTEGIPFDLTASVFGNGNKTDGVPQGVAWTATGSVVVDDNGKVTAVNDGDGTVTACSLAATNICATVNVTVPAGTIIKPTPKNSTTFYFKAEGYTSGNTKLRYRLLAEGNEDWSTEDTDPVLSNATNCSGWLSVTIDNPGLKAVEFLFYQGDSWYHSGSASSSSNFTLSAGQSAVAVQDYRAVNGAPSGCSAGGGSGSGGSTTTGTVIITGDSVVSLGKTITLTATPTPSSDTVTWYSGNTSVASVTAGSDNTATVKGLRAGTTTITAKTPSGATASVIVTVKDDSTVGVYFKKSAVNSKWSNYYLHYQKTADYWPAVKMEDACNGDYVVAYIPKADAHKGYGFLFRDSTDIKTGNWYGSNGWNTNGDNFTFWNNGKGMHIESNSDKGEGEPSACQTTRSVARVKARVPANRQRSSKTAVAGSGSSTTTVYSCGDALGKCDMNTAPGYFKVTDLADGTYTLTEMVAPNGYTAGGPYTVTITTVNGVTKVSITNAGDTAITGNKIPNTRNTGTISWNKVSSDSNNGKKLSGSEWKLTKTKNFGWNDKDKAEYTDIASADQKLITITDCVPAENKTAAETTCSAPAGAAEGQPYDVDPAAGQFKLEGLDWGTYTLVETKAPDGYDVDSTVRTFTFGPVEGSDVTGNWNSNSVAEGTADKTGAFTTADKTYDSDVFNFAVGGIKNQPGVVLPATGGTGNSWIYAAALVAALIGVVAAGMALKVRRRQ